MRDSISCSYAYGKFYDSSSDVSDNSDVTANDDFEDYIGSLDGKEYHRKLGRYEIFSTSSEVRNVYNASKRYNWRSIKCKIVGLFAPLMKTSREKIAKQVPACTEWKPHELKTAEVIERNFLRAKDPKRPYGIEDISIDGGTVELTVGEGAFYDPLAMLRSEFFARNYLSIIHFRFSRNGNEVYVERTSDGSFNYVVTKGSIIISRQMSTGAEGGICATVTADANGVLRVTDMARVRERYQRYQMSDTNVLISGVSLFEMLCNGRWKRDRDGAYVTNVRDYSTVLCTSVESPIVQNGKPPGKASTFKTGWGALELEAAKIIEKKFLRAKDGKCPYAIKGISINGGTIDLTIRGGAFCSPLAMLQSRFFTKNCLSAVNLKCAEGGSEIFVEKTSDALFDYYNHVVTKGSVVISRQESIDAGNRRATIVTIAGAGGAVKVTDVERVKEMYQRHQKSGVNILIGGVSVFEMLCNGNWQQDREGMYVTHVSDYRVAPSTALSGSDCVNMGGGSSAGYMV